MNQAMELDTEEERIRRTVDRLCGRFGDRVDRRLVEARVRASFRRFEGAHVREFVPILVEREIRGELVAAFVHS